MTANRLAAGKAGDGLVHDRLENRSREVLAGRALVDERLNVRLRKHAAARRNRVNRLVVLRVVVETRGVRLEQGSHLIDEGTRAARADAVHALVDAAGEVDDLCVLAAELNRDIRLRRNRLESGRDRDDLLHEGYV